MSGKLRGWLQKANGFQRLWLVLSITLFLYMVLINPFVLTSDSSLSKYKFRWAVEREFSNSECKTYLTQKIESLVEPQYSDEGQTGCWHIYTHRKYSSNKAFPYTHEMYEREFFWEHWEPILILSGVGAPIALVLSIVVYWLGKLIAWIIRGFRQTPTS